MSATVCGKRSFFEELSTSLASASLPVSKKLRCSSTSPVRISPFHNSPPASVLFDQLRAVFPNIDKQLLEKALEESGNDLDLAIKSLNELCLGYVDGNSGLSETEKYNTVENTSVHANAPRNGAEWVELFVTEMMNATSVDDARSRAMSILESLEKSIKECCGGEAAQSLHKENMVLKEQIEVVLRENTILKRAIAIQHERQKDYNDSTREVQHLKQLLSMHQEQLRTLQVNNYALTMHLKQAQESNSPWKQVYFSNSNCFSSLTDRCRLKEVSVLMANPTNNSEPPNVDSPMNSKRRRKKSVVWEHFTIETIDAGYHWIKAVSDGVHELFLDYVVQMLPPPTFVVNGNEGFLRTEIPQEEEETILHCEIVKTEASESEIYLSTSDELSDFDVYISGIANHQNIKPELDQYLEESVLPRMQEFDVLGWWKSNRKKYPTLSKLASDILSIPISTKFQDSVFDIKCKKMDRYRCSLKPSTLEALVCAKDWLQNGISDHSPDFSPSISPKSVMKTEL
ncbi:hypothetical protein L1987_87257 [Smallanthus sonchifolius]|nr:hypothetical protein L1987_87257 [Smallanthus sonchifolius]